MSLTGPMLIYYDSLMQTAKEYPEKERWPLIMLGALAPAAATIIGTAATLEDALQLAKGVQPMFEFLIKEKFAAWKKPPGVMQ
jgi:hypothetical protein